MDISLRKKYRTYNGDKNNGQTKYAQYGNAATARTGNSHGPAKSKMPASQPCGRAPAGAKVFTPNPQPAPRQVVMLVNGLTGASKMVAA